MVNTDKLKGRIKELGLTQPAVAGLLYMSYSGFNMKLNRKRSLTVEEADRLARLLKIEKSEIVDYFFA